MTTIRIPLRSTKMHLTAAERSVVLGALGRAGTYQHGYTHGHYSVSGADLVGLARKYGGKYRTSRESVHAACQRVGIELVEVRGYRGARSVWSSDALLALWTEGGGK